MQDSGNGINPEPANLLFAAFFSTEPNGMGIGLSIRRSFIDDHGGRIWASSPDGTGAVFQFTLPFDPGESR